MNSVKLCFTGFSGSFPRLLSPPLYVVSQMQALRSLGGQCRRRSAWKVSASHQEFQSFCLSLNLITLIPLSAGTLTQLLYQGPQPRGHPSVPSFSLLITLTLIRFFRQAPTRLITPFCNMSGRRKGHIRPGSNPPRCSECYSIGTYSFENIFAGAHTLSHQGGLIVAWSIPSPD